MSGAWSDPTFWLASAGLAWSVGNTLYMRIGGGRKDMDKKIEQAEKELKSAVERVREDSSRADSGMARDLNGYGERLSRAEERLLAMPTHEFLAMAHGEMHEKMNGIAADMSEIKGAMKMHAALRDQEKELRDRHNELLMQIHRKIMAENHKA